MKATICTPQQVPDLLPQALAGRAVLAPVGENAPQTLAMLQPEVPLAEPDAAVVVATSGSSGQPKGVVLSRAALLAAAESSQQRLGPMSWTCVLPTGYVAGLMVLVRAHVAGQPVHFASPDLSDLSGPASAPGPKAISIVPTQLFRAMDHPEVLRAMARYDAILLGGAAVDPDLLARARGHGLNLITTYGMSETCGGCVWDGEPLPGVTVDLGPSAEPVEAPSGRIHLHGDMVFSGYRLAPELTAATLQGRTVRTNDRGEWRDGRLHVLGRFDDVVISGGVNVDLAAVQRAVDAVEPDSGVVLALPDREWGSRVVLASTSAHDLQWWRTALADRLGRAALPRQLVAIDVVPRTSSGKIDRQSLLGELLDEKD
ncbi:AMP-binding protein [Luteococcus sp. OSA5]|uniref:AMP-binding protein n=1 Tax=Luteococcus sp. OSA5 TaxID=3401630 RepID=UPI003B429A46